MTLKILETYIRAHGLVSRGLSLEVYTALLLQLEPCREPTSSQAAYIQELYTLVRTWLEVCMELVVARTWLEAYMEVVLQSYMLLFLELYM